MDIEKEFIEYEKKRAELLAQNRNLTGVYMREKEQAADRYLAKKKEEYIASCENGVPYDMPTITDRNLVESELYALLDRMPKGADLHVHDVSLLPAHELVDFLTTCPEFCINGDRVSYDLKCVDPLLPAPEGYLRYAEALCHGYYTREELVYHWTTNSAAESGKNVWEYFEDLFCRQGCLSDNPSYAEKYYDYTFRYYCRHHIMHVEIHLMLTESMDEAEEYVRVVRECYYRVKKDYPDFTARIIGAGVKADNETIDYTRKCFLNASYVQEKVKDEWNPEKPVNFVIGFDLVNEEDTSLPLKDFVRELLLIREHYPEMKFYIHGGESLDANNENLIDAYLLGVSRVGHGLNLYRYPDLHARYVKAEICLEVCPISNQRLGYTKDLRNHPATEYLRTGMAMALCSDDPAYMEYHTLTDDFFAATVAWNLCLSDLKQFGINSIMYSGLDEETKYASLRAYRTEWDRFIDEVYERAAKE